MTTLLCASDASSLYVQDLNRLCQRRGYVFDDKFSSIDVGGVARHICTLTVRAVVGGEEHVICALDSDWAPSKKRAKAAAASKVLACMVDGADTVPPSAPRSLAPASRVLATRPYADEPWRHTFVLATTADQWLEWSRANAPLDVNQVYTVFGCEPPPLDAVLHARLRVLWQRCSSVLEASLACAACAHDVLVAERAADPLLAHVTPRRRWPLVIFHSAHALFGDALLGVFRSTCGTR